MECVIAIVGCNKVQPIVYDQVTIPLEVIESIQAYKQKLVDEFDNDEGSEEIPPSFKKIEDFNLPESLAETISLADADFTYTKENTMNEPCLTDDTPDDIFCLELKIQEKEFLKARFPICPCFGYICFVEKRPGQDIETVMNQICVI